MTGPNHQFPPGLQGGLEHDDEDHRLGETSQTGPESPGDIDRAHPEQGSSDADDDDDATSAVPPAPAKS